MNWGEQSSSAAPHQKNRLGCPLPRRAKHLLFYRNASSPRRKNKSLCENQKQSHIPCHPAPATEGVSRSPRHVVRGAVDAILAQGVRQGRVRSSRVVLIPRRWDQVSSIPRFRPCGRNAEGDEATEASKPGLWGERGVSRKAIAQGKPGCPGCTCSPCPCASAHGMPVCSGARDLRVPPAPGFPCALRLPEGHEFLKTRANRSRENAGACQTRCHRPRRRTIQYSRGVSAQALPPLEYWVARS
jgi:hypothetical protein